MEEKIKKSFLIFVILQPILDIYFLYTDKVVNLIGFSPSTIIRFIYIGVILLYAMYKYRKDKKIIPLIAYIGISGVYLILHHLSVSNFHSYDENNFGYSFFGEAFYIARLVMHVTIIFITTLFKFDFNDLKDVFCKTTFIISASIVVLNILGIALGSYNNEFIKGNIFTWFGKSYEEYGFLGLASKGWFNFANQISAILIMLMPFIIYEFFKEKSKFSIVNLAFTILSMIMLGTKVALYGTFLVIGCMLIIYIIHTILNKSKIDKIPTIILISFIAVYILLIPRSPAVNRSQITNDIMKNDENEIKQNEDDQKYTMAEVNAIKEKVKTLGKEEKLKFIKKFYNFYRIPDMFIKTGYSYKIDPDFWLEIMDKPLWYRLQYRIIEEDMIKRVVEINGDKNTNIFGISYCRVQNIFNIERDYVLQYYTIGIVGLIIFILPFAGICIVCGIKMLIEYKKHLNIPNMIMMLSALSLQGIAFYSGNVIDAMIAGIYLSFLLGVMINTIFKKEKKQENITI